MYKLQMLNVRRRTGSRDSKIAVRWSGFTLTELLIVMAILVLLVSLVVPRLLGSKQKADINSVKAQIGLFQAALERYATEMNKFPSTEEGLAALVSKPSGDGSESSTEDSESTDETSTESSSTESSGSTWDGPYLNTETLPSDPWGRKFSYEYPPTHNKINLPDIWSFGPDGQENTEDDIVSWTGKGGEESDVASSGESKE